MPRSAEFLVVVLLLSMFLIACSPGPLRDCPAGTSERAPLELSEVTLDVGCRGSGPAVVALHGFPEFGFSWDGLGDELGDGLRFITPSGRGYDPSDGPEGLAPYRIHRLVEDVRELIELVSDEPVVLIGHDWGGAVAWVTAHRYPELLRGHVAINSPHADVFTALLAEGGDQFDAAQYMNFLISDGAEDFLEANGYALLLDGFGEALSEDMKARYQAGYEQSMTTMLAWYRANIDSGPTPASHWPTGVTVEVPTLVLWGMRDGALLAENVDGLPEFVSDLRVVEFPDADHWIVHQETQGVANEILGFIDSL